VQTALLEKDPKNTPRQPFWFSVAEAFRTMHPMMSVSQHGPGPVGAPQLPSFRQTPGCIVPAVQ